MNIFLSWSGKKSHMVAKSFERCLKTIFHAPDIYLSSSMDKGIRWNPALNQALEQADFGILCMTKENCFAPWIIYEAGVLSRTTLKESATLQERVAPFLLDVRPDELPSPLSEFQFTVFEKTDLMNLVQTINQCHEERERISESVLTDRFEMAYESRWKELLNQARKTLAGVERLLDISKLQLSDILCDMKKHRQ